MGISVIPAPSASGKTMYKTTLTSGTSYTVPAGVTYLNVTLYGGGGGGGVTGTPPTAGGNGGTTTFTGATSATGGTRGTSGSANQNLSASDPTANTGVGGLPNVTNRSDVGYLIVGSGYPGQIISSTLAATAGSSISYSIGAGGTAGIGSGSQSSGTGSSGKIEIEYWA